MITRTIKINGEPCKVKLEPKDIDESLETLININMVELIRSEIYAKKYLEKNKSKLKFEKIVELFFSKQSLNSLMALQSALDKKIDRIMSAYAVRPVGS